VTKILLLGAGASYGNGNGSFESHLRKPPLVSNFFAPDEFMKIKGNYMPLLRYLKQILNEDYKESGQFNIEKSYAKIEGTWNLHIYNDIDSLRKTFGEEFITQSPIDWLKSLVNDIIYLTTSWLKDKTCPYHDFLVNNILHEGDSVISFNYDLIIDKSLQNSKKWNETDGYGFISTMSRKDLMDYKPSQINLYKPHGSMNWFRRNILKLSQTQNNKDGLNQYIPQEDTQHINVIKIEQAFQGYNGATNTPNSNLNIIPSNQKAFLDLSKNQDKDSLEYRKLVISFTRSLVDGGFIPIIVVPTPYKNFNDMTFGELQDIWRLVLEEIKSCDEIISIGYSFKDEHFNQLLIEASLIRDKKLIIKSINPTKVDDSEIKNSKIEFQHIILTLEDYIKGISKY
jgi:hypothetical protein